MAAKKKVRGSEEPKPKKAPARGRAKAASAPVAAKGAARAKKSPEPAGAPKPKPRRRKAAVEPPPPVEEAPPAAVAARGEEVDAERDPVAVAKLAVGVDATEGERPQHIPWSYGVDRVTAAAVDPDRLFVYWEVTDPAIERARTALGPGGQDAWLVLRVYDTSGRIFDGTNAHGYFDHPVERSTRQWFFQIGKPTSTAFVEVGMKSQEGFFAKIARSGRVDFPRREPAPWSEPEWMTVRPSSGEIAGVHRGMGAPPPPRPTVASQGPTAEPFPIWAIRDPRDLHEVVLRELEGTGWERVEWSEAGGEGGVQLEARVEWESPRVHSSWESGPLPYPVEIEPPHREQQEGKPFAWRAGGVTHVVQGPWRVVIRGLGAHAQRERLGTWEIHRSWAVHGGREVRGGPGRVLVRVGASEQVAAGGASERVWAAGSEVRMGGASERYRLGASEVLFRGATETLFAGASQAMLRGASERLLVGASERRLGGASERALPGASEARLGGASERRGEGADAPLPYPTAPAPAGREG